MPPFTIDFTTSGADAAAPNPTSLANQLDTFLRVDAKGAINERMALEHYNLETGVNDTTAAGGQGRHKAGYVGVMLQDTAVNIRAITGAGIGAMGLATDTLELYIYSASGWVSTPFGRDAIKDSETILLTGGTEDLDNDGSNTYVIADFTSANPDLDVTRIRSVHIFVEANSSGDYVSATYPDGAYEKVVEGDSTGILDPVNVNCTVIIPIDAGQVSFSMYSTPGSGYRLHHVTQHVGS